jgi:hypothetical protein
MILLDELDCIESVNFNQQIFILNGIEELNV